MKHRPFTTCAGRFLAGVMTLGFLLTPHVGLAKDKKKKDKDREDRRFYEERGRRDDGDRYSYRGKKRKYTPAYFRSAPRSSFSIVFGNGYRGPGYYYGPQDADYFYEGPGVSYYRSVEAIPGRYVSSPRISLEVEVQRRLARLGYYRGPIDGDIGPMSRRAIAYFQRDEGLRPTGSLTRETLEALGV